MKMKRAILLILVFTYSLLSFSQTVTIVNKKFVINSNASCPIYLNGANTPWDSWNEFGNSYSQTRWTTIMSDIKGKGINATRIWFSCNGSGQPSVASDGTVSAPTQLFWSNCDNLFALAQTNGVYVMATMMSFDHTKPSNANSYNWQQMVSSQAKTQTYIDNYLIPFVNRYKTNPYFFSVDLCNEIEWMVESGSANWSVTYDVLQRFVAQCSVALHGTSVARSDGTKVLVTMGSAGGKWAFTKMRTSSNGTTWQNNPAGNKWSDAALKAAFSNNANAYLDFYSPHYYGWLNEWYGNMFERSPLDCGIDEKPCMVGEMPARDPMPIPAISQTTAYNNMKTLGWQGHMPWTANITTNLTTEVGSLADFGAAALTFKNANSTLVVPVCSSLPKCQKANLGSDQSLCGVTGGVTLNANITITTNKTFKWYNGTTQVAGSTGTLTGVTTAGTYIVVVDSASGVCISRDTIIVSSLIPTPSLSGGTLCTPSTMTLNSGVSGSGLSYTWYLDGTVIIGESSASLAGVRKAGLYKVDVSAAGCTTKSASVTVSSNLPTPVDNCRADAGPLYLFITNTTGTDYSWYDVATGGTSLSSGTSFTTPLLYNTTTYYVQDGTVGAITLGKVTQSGSPLWGITDFTTTDKKQLLKILSATTLQSVKVYVVNSGTNVTIRIRNSADNTTIASKTFTGVGAGGQTLSNINISLPVGDYVIDADGTSNKINYEGWPNSNSYSYPYIASGVAELNNSETWNNVGYGPFYELTFAYGVACSRIPVIAQIDLTGNCTITNVATDDTKKEITCYPNPSNSTFTIQVDGAYSYFVYDVKGMLVETGVAIDKSIIGEALESGFYFLKVKTSNDYKNSKIIKTL